MLGLEISFVFVSSINAVIVAVTSFDVDEYDLPEINTERNKYYGGDTHYHSSYTDLLNQIHSGILNMVV